jgi:hypothetical protein
MKDSWKNISHPSAKQCSIFYLEGTDKEKKEIAQYVEKKSRQTNVKKRWKLLDRDIKEGYEDNIALRAKKSIDFFPGDEVKVIDGPFKHFPTIVKYIDYEKRRLTLRVDLSSLDNPQSPFTETIEDSNKVEKVRSVTESTPSEHSIGEIRALDFSMRATNALNAANIMTVEDLCRHSRYMLLRIPNLGKTTLNEIENFLAKHSLSLNTPIDSFGSRADVIKKVMDEGLVARIKNTLPQRDPRRKALKARMFEGATLEESGIILDVTRERIRQIESNIYRKTRLYNLNELATEKIIYLLLEKRKKPLSLWRLELEDPWFEGIGNLIKNVNSGQTFLINILEKEIQIEIINQEIILSLKSTKTLEEINKIVQEKKSFNIDFKEDIRMIALINGREELTPYCIELFEKGMNPRKASKIFTDSILLKNKEGLRLKDIAKKIEEIIGIQIANNAMSNAVSESPFLYLWGRLWRHENNFRKLDDEEIKKLSQEILLIMKEDPEKQWRSSGLSEILKHDYPNYKKLTEYDVDWALRKSRKDLRELDYRGRKAWGVRVKTGKKTKRKELVHLALEALEKHGFPMKTSEIRKQIKKVRDIKDGQQIHAKGDLIHYAVGMMGIRERDIQLSNDEQKNLFNLFELRLQTYPEDFFTSNNAKTHIIQTVANFEENNTFEKETLAIKHSRIIKSILNEIIEPFDSSLDTDMTSEIFNKSFSSDSKWIDKQIRGKRKWTSIIVKNKNKIVGLQKKLKIIEDQYGSDYRKIISDADQRLVDIVCLDELWSSSGIERSLATSIYPEKITYYQILRLLRMDKRFDVILSQNSFPEIYLKD